MLVKETKNKCVKPKEKRSLYQTNMATARCASRVKLLTFSNSRLDFASGFLEETSQDGMGTTTLSQANNKSTLSIVFN